MWGWGNNIGWLLASLRRSLPSAAAQTSGVTPGDPVNTKILLLVLILEVDFLCFAFGFFEIEITCCILLSKHIFCSVSSFSAVVGYSDNRSFLISPPQIIWFFPISPLQKALLNLLLLLIFSLIIHPRLWQIFDCLFFFLNPIKTIKNKQTNKQLYDQSKIRVKVQRFPMYTPSPASPFIDIPHQNGRFVITDNPTLTHPNHPWSVVYIRAHLILCSPWICTNL